VLTVSRSLIGQLALILRSDLLLLTTRLGLVLVLIYTGMYVLMDVLKCSIIQQRGSRGQILTSDTLNYKKSPQNAP